jgi:hypothetical protein
MEPICYRMYERINYNIYTEQHIEHLIKLCEQNKFIEYVDFIKTLSNENKKIYNNRIFNHCCQYNYDMCVLLLQGFTNINVKSSIHHCFTHNNIELIKMMINYDRTIFDDEIYVSIFEYACINNFESFSKWLYENRCINEDNIDIIFRQCLYRGLIDMCGWLLHINHHMTVITDDDMNVFTDIMEIFEDEQLYDEWIMTFDDLDI